MVQYSRLANAMMGPPPQQQGGVFNPPFNLPGRVYNPDIMMMLQNEANNPNLVMDEKGGHSLAPPRQMMPEAPGGWRTTVAPEESGWTTQVYPGAR